MLIGVTLGVIAGYFGGIVDQVVSYILTCQLALPGILFLLTIISIVGSSLTVVILVIGVLHWTLFLVVTRAATQRIRNLDYITAADAIGASKTNIIFSDILMIPYGIGQSVQFKKTNGTTLGGLYFDKIQKITNDDFSYNF